MFFVLFFKRLFAVATIMMNRAQWGWGVAFTQRVLRASCHASFDKGDRGVLSPPTDRHTREVVRERSYDSAPHATTKHPSRSSIYC